MSMSDLSELGWKTKSGEYSRINLSMVYSRSDLSMSTIGLSELELKRDFGQLKVKLITCKRQPIWSEAKQGENLGEYIVSQKLKRYSWAI